MKVGAYQTAPSQSILGGFLICELMNNVRVPSRVLVGKRDDVQAPRFSFL